MVTQVDGGRTSAPAQDRSATWPLASTLRGLAMAVAALVLAAPAVSMASPAGEAMTEFKDGKSEPDAVQNRFFLKEGRFEIEPFGGYVPNNPFARRYVFGANFGYHLKESLGFTGMVSYSPDLIEGDLKGLTQTLVQIAETGTGTAAFQQPLDKVTLAASFAVLWAPFYGKINLFGEQVVNFDFYATAGLGMVSKVDYYATYDDSGADGNFVAVAEYGNEVKFSPNLGLGANFFVTGSVAIKIDARFLLFFDNKPQYDPNETVTESRLYNNFVASVGPAFFFPAMKPRIYDF
jgi:outer membrane beta-barrel protein